MLAHWQHRFPACRRPATIGNNHLLQSCMSRPRMRQKLMQQHRDDLLIPDTQRQISPRYRASDASEAPTKDTPVGLRFPPADEAVLQRASAAWAQLCTQAAPPPPLVATQAKGPAPRGVSADHFDVVVLGGTLGILLAAALLAHSSRHSGQGSSQPLRVAVVERGELVGRDQEWNCTHADLQVLVELGVLSPAEVSRAIATHIPSVRMGVAGLTELQLTGVLELGVSPRLLLDSVKRRFLDLGGKLLEHTSFKSVTVYDDCAQLQLSQQQHQSVNSSGSSSSSSGGGVAAAAGGAGGRAAEFSAATASHSHAAASPGAGSSPLVLSAGVVVDALGSFSPLSAQARGGAAPEAAMLLVGSCLDTPALPAGVGAGEGADTLWALEAIDIATCQQYWWERFPADGGAATTVYMFTFTDPAPANRELLGGMVQHYNSVLGAYLGVAPDQLAVRRGVFGCVPCYSDRVTPLVDRLLPVGDSAANRSALSLAGFCALLRHLGRLTAGLSEALAVGATTRQELSLLQPWCPGVTATTAMQRTMSVHSNQYDTIRAAAAAGGTSQPQQSAVLSIMAASLGAMWEAVGEEGMRPFVADRIQLAPLAASMATQLRRDAKQLLDYSVFLGDTRGASRLLRGLAGLWLYGVLQAATPLTGPLHEVLLTGSPRLLYRWHRYTDAWRFGSGSDWVPGANDAGDTPRV